MLSIRVVTASLAVSAVVSYLFCLLFMLIAPESLHMHVFLEQVLPGFRWLTPVGFVTGLIETFLFGAFAGLVYVPIYNVFLRRWGR